MFSLHHSSSQLVVGKSLFDNFHLWYWLFPLYKDSLWARRGRSLINVTKSSLIIRFLANTQIWSSLSMLLTNLWMVFLAFSKSWFKELSLNINYSTSLFSSLVKTSKKPHFISLRFVKAFVSFKLVIILVKPMILSSFSFNIVFNISVSFTFYLCFNLTVISFIFIFKLSSNRSLYAFWKSSCPSSSSDNKSSSEPTLREESKIYYG